MCRACPNCRSLSSDLRKRGLQRFDAMCLRCCCEPRDFAFVETKTAKAKLKPTLVPSQGPRFGKADDPRASLKAEHAELHVDLDHETYFFVKGAR